MLRMSDEAHFLVKRLYSSRLASSSTFGVNRDGTSRKKSKNLGNKFDDRE